MTVHVTQEDIECGDKDNVFRCPIALALRRETQQRWMVKKHFAYYPCGQVHLSDPVQAFIADFDAGRQVSPFSFSFELEVEA